MVLLAPSRFLLDATSTTIPAGLPQMEDIIANPLVVVGAHDSVFRSSSLTAVLMHILGLFLLASRQWYRRLGTASKTGLVASLPVPRGRQARTVMGPAAAPAPVHHTAPPPLATPIPSSSTTPASPKPADSGAPAREGPAKHVSLPWAKSESTEAKPKDHKRRRHDRSVTRSRRDHHDPKGRAAKRQRVSKPRDTPRLAKEFTWATKTQRTAGIGRRPQRSMEQNLYETNALLLSQDAAVVQLLLRTCGNLTRDHAGQPSQEVCSFVVLSSH